MRLIQGQNRSPFPLALNLEIIVAQDIAATKVYSDVPTSRTCEKNEESRMATKGRFLPSPGR